MPNCMALFLHPWVPHVSRTTEGTEASVYLFCPALFLFSAGVQSKEACHRVALGCSLHPALEPASRDESTAADPA